MDTNEVQSFLKLIRVDYSIYSACGVLLSGLLAGDLTGIQSEYLITFFIVFFAAVSAYALNDYFDFEVDKKNKRLDRPLVLGGLTRKTALKTGIISLSLTLLLTIFLSIPAMVLIYSSLPLFFLYSMWLKKFFVFKNILVAYGYFVTIVLGSIISDAYIEPLIIYFALMGFILILFCLRSVSRRLVIFFCRTAAGFTGSAAPTGLGYGFPDCCEEPFFLFFRFHCLCSPNNRVIDNKRLIHINHL